MNAELVAIGTELLLGYTVNTNTAFLSRRLAELGVDCYRHVTVGDNPARLAEAVRTALGRADCVITCGGLGPTVDDITLAVLTKVAQRPLVLDHAVLSQIRARFVRMGIPMPQSNLRQAYVPRGALVLPNTVGTAPGFLLPLRKKLLIALPGPPRELEPMVTDQVLPWLKAHRGLTGVLRSRTLHLTGITESEVDEQVADLLKLKGAVTVGIYAHAGQVDLRITAKGDMPAGLQKVIHTVEHDIRARMEGVVFGADDETLEQVVGTLLTKSRKTVALAESCTGGLIGHRLTQVPGSSAYFLGGAVAYANPVKTALTAVPAALLRRHGAVSEPVVRQMAAGIRKALRADYGLAVTGIAGPTGGTAQKPVGTVHLAVADAKHVVSRALHLTGDRAIIKARAAQAALDFLRTTLADTALAGKASTDKALTKRR